MTSIGSTLDQYSKLVEYELTELINLAEWQQRPWPIKVPAEITFRNAMLESGLVHARNLLEFLLNFDNNKKNVIARDFVPTWKPSGKKALSREYGRICEHLAHLSKTRAAPQVKETWDLRDPAQWIVNQLDDLAGSLPSATPYASRFQTMVCDGRLVLQRIRGTQTLGPLFTTGSTITGTTGPPPTS